MTKIFPATYNIKLKQGNSFYRKITVKNRNTRVLTNFTGYSGMMDIKAEPRGSSVISLSTENGGIVLGEAKKEWVIKQLEATGIKVNKKVDKLIDDLVEIMNKKKTSLVDVIAKK